MNITTQFNVGDVVIWRGHEEVIKTFKIIGSAFVPPTICYQVEHSTGWILENQLRSVS